MRPIVLLGVAALVFVGALVVGLLAWWAWQARRQARAEALARRLGIQAETRDDPLLAFQQEESLAAWLGGIGDGLQRLIRQADAPYDLGGLLRRVAAFALLGLVAAGIALRSALAFAGLLLGLFPLWLLRRQARKRALRLSEQLPDALDLVARSLQAGHGLSDAMRLCAEEMQDPVATEFGRVYEEHNLGRDLRDCLDNLAERNPGNFDLKIFVSSVLLQRDTGGNLIEILENISKTIRDRFVFQAKVRALTAETRMSALILGGLPFILALLISFVRPDYLDPLFDDPIGRVAGGAGLGWFLTGVLVMRNLTRIEV